KITLNPPHDATLQLLQERLVPAVLPGWCLRIQSAITLSDSEPEPDGAIVRGPSRTYSTRHPGPADIGVVIEVSDSTLAGDRADQGRIYARAGLRCYWIVNLVDGQIEVYTQPSGPTAAPVFGQRTDYHLGGSLPLILDGTTVATVAVADLLP